MSTFNVLPGLGYLVQRDEDTGRACDECRRVWHGSYMSSPHLAAPLFSHKMREKMENFKFSKKNPSDSIFPGPGVFLFISFHEPEAFLFLNLFIYLFFGGDYFLLQCVGFLLWWLLLLRSMGSRHAGFSSCGTWAQ